MDDNVAHKKLRKSQQNWFCDETIATRLSILKFLAILHALVWNITEEDFFQWATQWWRWWALVEEDGDAAAAADDDDDDDADDADDDDNKRKYIDNYGGEQ